MTRFIIILLLCLMGTACSQEPELAGQDGSGKVNIDDPIAVGTSSITVSFSSTPSIPDEPASIPAAASSVPAASIPAASSSPSVSHDTVAAMGVVNKINSLSINGESYLTDDVIVNKNNSRVDLSSLHVGDMVKLEGRASEDKLYADIITIEPTAIGPLEAIDLNSNTIQILGQTTLIVPETLFAPSIKKGISALKIHQNYEVSGWSNDKGEVTATRISPKGSLAKVRLRGIVQHHNEQSKLFHIGRTQIDYSNINQTAVIADGKEVFVSGELNTNEIGGLLFASQLTVKNNYYLSKKLFNVTLKGPATNISANRIFVQGVAVHITGSTKITPHSQASLTPNTIITVKGTRRVNGSLNASSITVIAQSEEFISGYITQIEVDQHDPNRAILRIANMQVRITQDTTLSKSNTVEEGLSADELIPGDVIKVAGVFEGQEFKASSLLLLDEPFKNTQILFKRRITKVDPTTWSLEVDGFTLRTRENTQYIDTQGNPHERDAFFIYLMKKVMEAGNINIWVSGKVQGSEIICTKVYLKKIDNPSLY